MTRKGRDTYSLNLFKVPTKKCIVQVLYLFSKSNFKTSINKTIRHIIDKEATNKSIVNYFTSEWMVTYDEKQCIKKKRVVRSERFYFDFFLLLFFYTIFF